LRREVLADHPAFGVGLMTDRRLRPMDQDGKVVLENLFAAGSVLGGYNYHTGGCGLGVCALTGYRAGREANGEIT
jgi:glycerol-3-phosphate dehydrogenase subunit B